MRWRISLAAVLALFVAVSCDQQPVEPLEQAVAEAPAFNFMNGPEEAGVVWRGQMLGFWWWEHADVAVEFVPAEDLGDYVGYYDCGGSTDVPLYDTQVAGDEEKGRLHVVGQKVTPVYIFDLEDLYTALDSGDEEVFCDFYENEWIYGGEARVVWTDNNMWGDPQYTNVWGFTANGFVWDKDGVRYNYHQKTKLYYNPNTDVFGVTHDVLSIH
jgi:hypothetical protein